MSRNQLSAIHLRRSWVLCLFGAFALRPTSAGAEMSSPSDAQQAGGTWKLRYFESHGWLLDITFQFLDGSHDHNQLRTDLGQLAITPVSSGAVQVDTSLMRDAGAIILTGEFTSGEGAGSATFRPDSDYLGYLQSLGFSGITPRDSLDLALFDVDRSFASRSKAEFPSITQRDLVSWRIMRVQSDYASFLRRTVPGIVPKDVVTLRIAGVTTDDVNRLTAANHGPLDAASLLKLKSEGNL